MYPKCFQNPTELVLITKIYRQQHDIYLVKFVLTLNMPFIVKNSELVYGQYFVMIFLNKRSFTISVNRKERGKIVQ